LTGEERKFVVGTNKKKILEGKRSKLLSGKKSVPEQTVVPKEFF
jgi:hypothetical protein